MPKRTNDFQNLIAHIYEQLRPTDAQVTESAMVRDQETGELREVDILIEYMVAGHPMKIGVECRDRSRKESVGWIEELVGKKNALHLNKAIAVSSKGFTGAAERKAKRNGIEVHSLLDAEKVDWASTLPKQDLVMISAINYRLYSATLYDEKEEIIDNIQEISDVMVGDSNVVQFKQFFYDYFVRNIRGQMHDLIKINIHNILKNALDLEKEILLQKEITIPNLSIKLDNDEKVKITKVNFIVFATFKSGVVEQDHHVYMDTLVSRAVTPTYEGKEAEIRTLRNTSGDIISFAVVDRNSK